VYEETLQKVQDEAASLKRRLENLDTEPTQAEVRAAMEEYSSEQLPAEGKERVNTLLKGEKNKLNYWVREATILIKEAEQTAIPLGLIARNYIFGLVALWSKVKDAHTQLEACIQKMKVLNLELAVLDAIEDIARNDEGLQELEGLGSDDDE
jgi:hypothetical protein